MKTIDLAVIQQLTHRLRKATDAEERNELLRQLLSAMAGAIDPSDKENSMVQIVDVVAATVKQGQQDDISRLRAILKSPAIKNDGKQLVEISRLLRELRERKAAGD